MDLSYIKRNTERILERVERAAQAAGRRAEDITVLAAVKYARPDEIDYLCRECGILHIGENRVQQLLEHMDALTPTEGRRLHFIGTLQTNKVKYIADKVDMIESVDSLKLASEIDRQAKKQGRVIDVLCEINSGREANKSGVMPEDALEFCEQLLQFSSISLCGVMTMAPVCEKTEDYRKYFSETYQL
jgi:pyridoxal phosphate enzyme (YggS family)